MQKLIKMKPTKLGKIKEKEKVYNTVSQLYNNRFKIYYNECNELSDAKKDKLNKKFKPIHLRFRESDMMDGLQKKN